jgi:hypothetical protein
LGVPCLVLAEVRRPFLVQQQPAQPRQLPQVLAIDALADISVQLVICAVQLNLDIPAQTLQQRLLLLYAECAVQGVQLVQRFQ